METSLVVPAFIAGILTFLAPCTLPLLPGYLSFISGVPLQNDKTPNLDIRKKIFLNGLFYVIGFTIVFVLLGSLFGLIGSVFVEYRFWLSRIGGLFVVFFGLYMIGIFNMPFFNFLIREKRFSFGEKLTPGKPISSVLFGMIFALGWTPCVGPILGSILVLASTSGTVLQGALLLFIFSLGLSAPFLLLALGFGHATSYIKKLTKYMKIISIIGGVLLVFLGTLLLTGNIDLWAKYFHDLFGFINYDGFFDHL